ncbi:MAG TPA: GNAT family protein [Acidimicrobiia bacterium]|nr:GNAT family protein [Acidimicrobiia bacterium]
MTGTGPDRDARNTHRLSTERLRLEVPTDDDAPVLFHLAGGEDRAEIMAGLIWDGPDKVSDTRLFVEQSQTRSYGDFGFHWAIKDRTGAITGSPGRAMGMIGTRPIGEPGRGDVGYWLGKAHWGRQIMAEALGSVLELCFGRLDMVKIEAEIFTTNARSIRLVEGVGMKLEGTIRSAHFKRGQWVDVHVYGILRDEWLAMETVSSPEPHL